MKEKSESSRILYRLLMEKGYSEEFSNLISQNLNTDFTEDDRLPVALYQSAGSGDCG